MFPAYIQPPLEFKLVDSQGIPCRAKFWPSKKHCETYLLFIPGNPGVISYYDEFLTSLHDDSPNTTILGVSLAGHEEYEVNPPLSLQQEIHSKLRIVDTIFQSSPFTSLAGDKPRFIVMGHSVGAYISFEILKQRPQQVDNLFLLFPTLSALSEGSTFGRFASVVTQVPYASVIAALITFIFRLIFPIPLLALWLRLGHSLTGTSLSVTLAKLFNPASVRSFSYLARHEFRDIRELDVDSLTKYAKRITAYYAVQDGWVPNTERERIMGIINGNGGDAFICNEGFPHAFSLIHGPQMSTKISLWISSLFHPITSPTIEQSESQAMESISEFTIPWTISDQEAGTLVNTSPDLGRTPGRKESLGSAAIVHEQLIRDLE